MACVHLQQLYKLCHQHEMKLGGPDLIRIVCHECGEQEVCPSNLMEMDDTKTARPQPAVDANDSPAHESSK